MISEKGYHSNVITPHEKQPKLAQAIGLSEIYFKREDLHPYGSHKGRSIPVMIDHYVDKGEFNFAISSSGNAGLAAAMHVKKLNNEVRSDHNEAIKLDIFVGNNANKNKVEKIRKYTDENIRILIKERPLQALTQAISEGYRSLRQSTDDVSLLGYAELAKEIVTIKNAAALFIGTSSGTTAQALSHYFLENKVPIQVHIVQTSSCHPIAEAFDGYDGPEETSIADAIVDITAQRRDVLVPLIEDTGGKGWIATNEDIVAAQELVASHCDLDISTNSALSVVGAMKTAYVGHEIEGAVVCMICGD